MQSAPVIFQLAADQCLACGVCADICPTAALRLFKDDLAPTWVEAACDGCALCQRECPTGAIVVGQSP